MIAATPWHVFYTSSSSLLDPLKSADVLQGRLAMFGFASALIGEVRDTNVCQTLECFCMISIVDVKVTKTTRSFRSRALRNI
jgi:hypothetical protein